MRNDTGATQQAVECEIPILMTLRGTLLSLLFLILNFPQCTTLQRDPSHRLIDFQYLENHDARYRTEKVIAHETGMATTERTRPCLRKCSIMQKTPFHQRVFYSRTKK